MKKTIILTIFLFSVLAFNPAYGHKLITHDDTHRSFDSALEIPDHKISWAIYEKLGTNEAKFYTFDAKKGDSFYASIVIPKIQGLEEYSPSLILTDSEMKFKKKVLYESNFPGSEFYEPFGQVTYWERQEMNLEIPHDGNYFIIVMDEKNQSGKYSLAVGTIEDFSGADLFTILPAAWFETKIFVNDFASVGIALFILISITIIPVLVIIKKRKLKNIKIKI